MCDQVLLSTLLLKRQNHFHLQMQEKLQQLQSQLIGHEAAKRDLEKTLADKSDSESEEKQKLIQVRISTLTTCQAAPISSNLDKKPPRKVIISSLGK